MMGKGNFASVYQALSFTTGTRFAVKTIDKKLILDSKRNLVSNRVGITTFRLL